jgi:hypothetical protein
MIESHSQPTPYSSSQMIESHSQPTPYSSSQPIESHSQPTPYSSSQTIKSHSQHIPYSSIHTNKNNNFKKSTKPDFEKNQPYNLCFDLDMSEIKAFDQNDYGMKNNLGLYNNI